MGRIGSAISGLERTLLHRLATANANATVSTLRLATGNNINSPADDPSAFTILSRFQSRLATVRSAMKNVTTASSLVTQSQTTLGNIRTQLEAIQTELLTDEQGALGTQEARDTAQAKIDAAITEINQLATKSIDGRQLLDGSADFQISGRDAQHVSRLTVYSTGGEGPVVAAQQAQLTYSGTDRYARFDAQLRISGNKGNATINVTADDTLEFIAEQISGRVYSTGITASVDDNTLTLTSVERGGNETIDLEIVGGTITHIESNTTLGNAATFDLTGSGGVAHNFAFNAGDTLESVVDTINAEQANTKVQATLDGTSILLQNLDSSDTASVTIDNVTGGSFAGVGIGESLIVTGGRSTQSASGVSAAYGSTPAISGEVTQAATQAELVYTGTALDQIADTASFTLTGRRGSASITVNAGEDLTLAAARINELSHKTGITATVNALADADTLTLTTVDYGTEAIASITNVTGGAFDVAGGDGAGTDYGTNAVAVINGVTYSGNTPAVAAELRHREKNIANVANDATIQVTGHLGTSGDINITAADSLQDVATLIEAQKATTGVTAYVDGNDLVLQDTLAGSDSIVSVNVSAGTFDTVSDYTPATRAELTYTGTNGTVTNTTTLTIGGSVGSVAGFVVTAGETLAEAAFTINQETENTGVFAVVESGALYLRSSTTGTSASISVVETAGGPFTLTGGNGDGTADGIDATATRSGTNASTASGSAAVTDKPSVDGNKITVNEKGFRYTIEFAEGFSGQFNPISVVSNALTFAFSGDPVRTSALSIQGVQASQLGGISGTLDQLATGGVYSGLDGNTSHALRIVDEALARLTLIEGNVDGFYDASISTSSKLLAELEEDLEASIDSINKVDEDEEAARESYYLDLASNAVAGLAILHQQRQSIIAMIKQIAGLA